VTLSTTSKRERMKEYLTAGDLRRYPSIHVHLPQTDALTLLADLTPEEIAAIDEAGLEVSPWPLGSRLPYWLSLLSLLSCLLYIVRVVGKF